MSPSQPAHGTFSNVDVDTIEAIAVIPTRGAEALAFQFVVGTANLSDFLIEGRVHPDAGYTSIANVTGDFTTPVFPVLKASGDLNAAASGATNHYALVDVRGLYDVRLSAAGTSSTVTGYWGTI